MYGFRYQTFSPIRNSYPIAYFCIAFLHVCTVYTVAKHDTHTSYGFLSFFQYHSVCFRGRENVADNISAIFHRCVWRPSCYRTDIRVLSIFVKCFCIIFVPSRSISLLVSIACVIYQSCRFCIINSLISQKYNYLLIFNVGSDFLCRDKEPYYYL